MCFGGLTPFVGRSSLLGGILEPRRAKGVLASFCGQIRSFGESSGLMYGKCLSAFLALETRFWTHFQMPFNLLVNFFACSGFIVDNCDNCHCWSLSWVD